MSPADDSFISGGMDNSVRNVFIIPLEQILNSHLEDLSTKNFLYIHFMLSLQESRSTIEISAHVTFPSVERLGMKPVCAFDPEGIVFSVGVQSEQVKL